MNADDYGLDEPGSPVYSHGEVMKFLQDQLANYAKSADNSGIISKLQTDNEQLASRVNKLNTLEAENERLRSELTELKRRLDSTDTNVATLNQQVTPMYTRYIENRDGKVDVLRRFFPANVRQRHGSRLLARDLNMKVYRFSSERGIPIPQTEVKELVTNAPFNLQSYKSTDGLTYYRDVEFIPMEEHLKSTRNVSVSVPKINGSVSPRSPLNSPAINAGTVSPPPVVAQYR